MEKISPIPKSTAIPRVLLIGLGGFGRETLSYIRTRFVHLLGSIPEHLRLLGIDVDSRGGDTLSPEELLLLSNVPVDKILLEAERGTSSPLHGWLDTEGVRLAPPLGYGTGGSRQLGRLAFIWHAEAGPGSLNLREQFIRRLRRFLGSESTVYVYVVASLAGGFGSGAFLDFAFWLRDVLGQRIARMVAFLITPTFFNHLPQDPLQANAWATLQELNYFQHTSPTERRTAPRLEYFRGRSIPTERSPFDNVFLVDAIDATGRNIAHPTLAVRLIGEMLLATEGLPEDVWAKVGSGYSALGFASLVVPIEEIVGLATLELLNETIQQWLSVGFEPPSSVGSLSGEVLENLSFTKISERFQQTVGGVPRLWLSEPDINAILEKAAERERVSLSDELDLRVEMACRNMLADGGSLSALETFLRRAKEQLDAAEIEGKRQQQEVEDRLRTLSASLQRAEEQYLNLRSRPESLRNRFLKTVRSPQEAAAECLELRKRYIDTLGERVILRKSLDVAVEVRERVNSLQRIVNRFRNLLAPFTEYLQNQQREIERQLADLPTARAFPVLQDRENIRRRYRGPEDRYWEQAWRQFQKIAGERFLEWGEAQADVLFQNICEAAREAWSQLYKAPEFFIEGFLEQDPRHWWEELERRTAAFWAVDAVEALVKEQRILPIALVEVYQSDRSVLIRERPDYARGEHIMVVEREDPFRVRMIKFIRGVHPRSFALRKQFMEAYHKAIARYEPVHVFPDFYLGSETDNRRQVLARAWAYGYITRQGDEFFLRRLTDSPPEPLGVYDLFDLLWKTANDEGLYGQLQRLVLQGEQSMNREDLLNALDKFQPVCPPSREEDERWLWEILQDEIGRYRRSLL